jgi:acyl-CoA thioesterase-1
MKVLCIGDSLALPGHHNKYEDTWFYKLKKEFPGHDFISFFKRQLTTEILVTIGGGEKIEGAFPTGADCLEHYMPEIVIIQLGIVDCAPRLINEKSFLWKIVRRLPDCFLNHYINYL